MIYGTSAERWQLRPERASSELMARLGHSSTRAAMIYQHATRDRDEAIAKALGGLMHQVRSERAATPAKAS